MTRNGKQGLVKRPALTETERAEVDQLAALCRRDDALDLGIVQDLARLEPDGESNQLLYLEAGKLIGFMTVQPGPEIELYGMVHPAHRRKGVGRALLAAAQEECRRRGSRSLLLVCEEASTSGRAFAEAVGAEYRCSEYQMELDRRAINRQPPHPSLHLERTGAEDAATLVRLTAASFGDSEEEVRPRIMGWLQQVDQRFYIGRLDGEPIGSLRVFLIPDDSRVFINTFGVIPQYRGRGYGRQILAATIEDLLDEQWKRIMIEVGVENPRALSVYRSCGFKEVITFRFYRLAA
jgi:ribosomal protein S18 acetylase RimI-like enzyme